MNNVAAAALFAMWTAVAVADELVVFVRPGCEPCRRLKSTLLGTPGLTNGLRLNLVDTERHPLLAKQYGVTAVPVLVVERDGREVARKVGYSGQADLQQWLNQQKKDKP